MATGSMGLRESSGSKAERLLRVRCQSACACWNRSETEDSLTKWVNPRICLLTIIHEVEECQVAATVCIGRRVCELEQFLCKQGMDVVYTPGTKQMTAFYLYIFVRDRRLNTSHNHRCGTVGHPLLRQTPVPCSEAPRQTTSGPLCGSFPLSSSGC